MKPQTHTLKCDETYFAALRDGRKNFEVRRNDRGFQTGDQLLILRTRTTLGRTEYVNTAGVTAGQREQSAEALRFTVSYILQGGQFGIEPAFCVLALRPGWDGDA